MKLSEGSLKITPKRQEQLAQLGITTDQQLLSYYPYRYEFRTTAPFADWKIKEHVFFEGRVISPVSTVHFGRSRSLARFDVMAEDHVLHITIFNRPWARQLQEDQLITIQGIYMGQGKVTATSYNTRPMAEQENIVPQYSTRSGIPQRTIRESIRRVLEAEAADMPDPLPSRFVRDYRLLHLPEAYRRIHFPRSQQDIDSARRTLKYEEFLRFFTAVQMLRLQNSSGVKPGKQFSDQQIQALIRSLPFALTRDQQSVIQDILRDLHSTAVMYRLVQGDVGCGKTVVAAAGLYANCLAGYQGALLAPTEILAQQHFSSLQKSLQGTGMKFGVLYSGLERRQQEELLAAAADGSLDLLIGTHSLLQERVQFKNLGMVVVDEQQRFGVEQRKTLRSKGHEVDFLLMTATPIPRTLASTLYGDMDVSTIETMPAGRKPVETVLIQENSFRSVLPQVQQLLREGRQLYVICAAVEQNEDYDARNVHATARALQKLFQPDYRVGLLHGRMKAEEKARVMQDFADNRLQVLVSTTVVEVGVNVVNATGMIVYDADRFGLSQLHQLRGRVQRGSGQGHCWLLTSSRDSQALERLQVLVRSSNGFEISYEDLRLRGPGDILGTRQSGVPDFILGNPIEDTRIVNQARKDAQAILADPNEPENAAYLERIRQAEAENSRD